jgi:ABC-type branched-subunit amino acid transport system ATPase component
VVAAADINVDIAAGERVSLIGSNGAGKTTFVNMITGYLKPGQRAASCWTGATSHRWTRAPSRGWAWRARSRSRSCTAS